MGNTVIEPSHNIFYTISCAPGEDPDQPANPRIPIRVFVGHSVGSQEFKRFQRDVEDFDQPDLNLRWAQMQFRRK